MDESRKHVVGEAVGPKEYAALDAQTAAPVTLPPATGRGMGTTLDSSKPVLATYSSPVIAGLTLTAAEEEETLDDAAGALAGWARSVYGDAAWSPLQEGSHGVALGGGGDGGGGEGVDAGVAIVAVGSPDSERRRWEFVPAESAADCFVGGGGGVFCCCC